MARTYAKVKVAIWGDPDFRLLSPQAQHLYFMLLTSPSLNLCGVCDWRPNRIAPLCANLTIDQVREAADELEQRLFVLFDDDTEEALVRTFIRHDGTLKTPNVAAAVFKDYAGVASADLRGVVVHELQRLKADEPDLKGWTLVGEVLTNPSVNPSVKVSGKVSVKVSPNPSVKVSTTVSPMESVKVSDIPQPSTLNPQTQIGPARRASKTALPADWEPSPAAIKYGEEHGIDVDHEAGKFRAHHLAKDSRFARWDQAFRTWLGNAVDYRRPQQEQQQSVFDEYELNRIRSTGRIA